MMDPVSFADLVAFIASATAVLFVLRGWKRTPFPRDIRLLLLCLLTLTLGHDLSNLIEWTGLTTTLDVFEDYVEVTIPLLWSFLFYAFFQENTSAELRRREMALSQSEERYRSLVENALDGYFIAELPEGRFLFINQKACDIFGYTEEEVMKITIWDAISPEDYRTMEERIKRRFDGEQLAPPLQVYKAIRKDGSPFLAEVSGSRVFFQGKPVIQGLIRDVTEQRRLQEQFQQAQKMEAVGTLAGGIAHDFNNLLMAIQGSVSLMLFELNSGHPFYERLKGIEKQVQSGARLTHQLLGYARKGRYEVRPVDLNNLVRQTAEAFGRARKEITLELDLAHDLLAVEADENQIEQVLLNLLVNAADAMARKRGMLTLETKNVNGDILNDKPYRVKPGQYVLLMVTDTGVGMTKQTMDRIFEPFFTTKEMGRGTGLGLASAYGIVKGHGGYIDVDSRVGTGTTFKVYLPASKRKPTGVIATASQIVPGQGTVLLVDDEETILDVGTAMVNALGFEVLAAKSGEEALRCLSVNRGKIDLVILDMVMPEMGGGEVFDRIREHDRHIKVLLSSGYSIDGQASEILSRGCDGFIQKPFDMNQLSRSIEALLKKDTG
ncbi:MAG: PAS domain S-box protein [Deltaproteobacteria bacterium]|nr:PAS domain S-box protein [Deltaproteobacteria bacterium]